MARDDSIVNRTDNLKVKIDYLNDIQKKIYHELGPFKWEEPLIHFNDTLLQFKDEAGNGNNYQGQVNKETKLREGMGVFYFKKGLYEGYWLNGVFHHRGRIIYKDGKIYDG